MCEDDVDATFQIRNIWLLVPVIRFSDNLYLSIRNEMKTKVARQPITKFEYQIGNIPSGSIDYHNNSLTFMTRPERIIVSTLEQG